MKKPFTLTAQLSTGHSLPQDLTIEKVLPVLRKAMDIVTLDILIVGWEEIPDLYHMLVDKDKRIVKETFLWYPMLSDFPGMKSDHLVIDYKGQPSQGWGDFVASGEMSETFRFACPNNPEGLQISLSNLERILCNYDFDGVFLDKIRFPSPANGLSEFLSCFCTHCRNKASQQGLDLEEVRQLLLDFHTIDIYDRDNRSFQGASWIDKLLQNYSLIKEFIRFKCDSISDMVDQVSFLTNKMGRKLALDVFSPGLAPLVGQDLSVISKKAEWVKPMIYRFAKGPASLRLEIPELVKGMITLLNFDENDVVGWIEQNIPGLTMKDYYQIEKMGTPLGLIDEESDSAIKTISPTPVYLGLETVRIPGVIEITLKDILEIVKLSKNRDLSGLALSWDLLHTPPENLKPLKDIG